MHLSAERLKYITTPQSLSFTHHLVIIYTDSCKRVAVRVWRRRVRYNIQTQQLPTSPTPSKAAAYPIPNCYPSPQALSTPINSVVTLKCKEFCNIRECLHRRHADGWTIRLGNKEATRQAIEPNSTGHGRIETSTCSRVTVAGQKWKK